MRGPIGDVARDRWKPRILARMDKGITMRRIKPNRGPLVLAASMAALIAMATGLGGEARAATATETGFAVPGAVHRGNGQALHAPSGAGMPATVADFLAGQGHGAATVDSLRVKREMAVGDFGATVLDLTQEVDGLAVYGVQVRAIFDGDGNLTTLSENVVSAGPVAPAAIGPRAALDAALGKVHPGVAIGLSERGGAGNSTSFGGDDFFFQDPSVTRVAIPMSGGALREGFLVETWSEDDNQLDYTLVGGNGQVLNVQSRTNNVCGDPGQDCYNVFAVHPDTAGQTTIEGPGDGNVESPLGWLDVGTQWTRDIQGNNVHAYLDWNDDDASDGAGSEVGDGDFTAIASLGIGSDPREASNPDVAVQNLFYLNNMIHDVLFSHGFEEAQGNFQETNYSGIGNGSDSVDAEAQDGKGADVDHLNNANFNFATPSDGSNPRMQMYLWRLSDLAADGATYNNGFAMFGPGNFNESRETLMRQDISPRSPTRVSRKARQCTSASESAQETPSTRRRWSGPMPITESTAASRTTPPSRTFS